MQINNAITGGLPLRSICLQQLKGSPHLLVRLFGVVFGAFEKVRTKGTIEIGRDTDAHQPGRLDCQCGLHLATAAVDQSWITGPLLQQPGAIDLIAVGARHHQHSGFAITTLHSSSAWRTMQRNGVEMSSLHWWCAASDRAGSGNGDN